MLVLLREAADAVAHALGDLEDWGLAGTRAGQYRSDLAADAVALEVLLAADVGVLSEESGLHRGEAGVVVVVDPLDGSTNASRGIPWYATSLCAVDDEGPLAAVVVDLASGSRFEAIRGGGATHDGRAIHVGDRPGPAVALGDAIIGLSGLPPRHLGWRQFRALGAVALDLCAVATGVLGGYIDCSFDAQLGLPRRTARVPRGRRLRGRRRGPRPRRARAHGAAHAGRGRLRRAARGAPGGAGHVLNEGPASWWAADADRPHRAGGPVRG